MAYVCLFCDGRLAEVSSYEKAPKRMFICLECGKRVHGVEEQEEMVDISGDF